MVDIIEQSGASTPGPPRSPYWPHTVDAHDGQDALQADRGVKSGRLPTAGNRHTQLPLKSLGCLENIFAENFPLIIAGPFGGGMSDCSFSKILERMR